MLSLLFSTELQQQQQHMMLLQEAQRRRQSNAKAWNKADFTNPSRRGCTATLALGVWWQQQTEWCWQPLPPVSPHVSRSIGYKAKEMCIFNAQSSTSKWLAGQSVSRWGDQQGINIQVYKPAGNFRKEVRYHKNCHLSAWISRSVPPVLLSGLSPLIWSPRTGSVNGRWTSVLVFDTTSKGGNWLIRKVPAKTARAQMKSIWIQQRTVIRFLPHLQINASSLVLGVWKVKIRVKNWESVTRRERRVPDMRRARVTVDYWDDWRVIGASINHRRHAGSCCHSLQREQKLRPWIIGFKRVQTLHWFNYRNQTKAATNVPPSSIFICAHSSLESCWITTQHTVRERAHTLTERGNLESPIILKWEEKGKKAHRGSGEHANSYCI